MRKNIFVFAHLHVGDPVIAGILEYDETNRFGMFRYAKSYLARGDAIPLSMHPAFALTSTAVTETANDGLPGPIRDAMPDYWGRLVFAGRNGLPVEKVSNADILLADVAERVGFLDFSSTPEWSKRTSSSADIPMLEDLEKLVQTADALANHQLVENKATWALQLLAQGTSMGGARPKSVIQMNGALWMAKFPAKDDHFDVSAVEHATHRMAAHAGITVPDAHLLGLPDGRHVFLSKRFDRANNQRIPMVSALTSLGLDESENAKGSYMSVANILRQQGDEPGAKELFRRMVFNAFIRNTDDHLRNHAFLYSRQNRLWEISPAYDVNPSISRSGVGEEFDLSINVGVHGRAATLENLLSAASDFGMEARDAECVVRKIADVITNWVDYFKESDVDKRTMSLFADTFDSGLRKFEIEDDLPNEAALVAGGNGLNDGRGRRDVS